MKPPQKTKLVKPQVPDQIARLYSRAVVKRARTRKECQGHFCTRDILPGDYYVQPGLRSYGILDDWCWCCGGLKEEQALAGRKKKDA